MGCITIDRPLQVQYVLLHEEYQQYVLPRIAESKKLAKAGRAKGGDADVEYNLAKQVEKQIWLVCWIRTSFW